LGTKIVEIIYFDAGGGHRNAMNAIARRIERHQPGWIVRPVDLQKVLEPIDPVHRLTQRVSQSLHRLLVPVAPKFHFAPWQAQDIYNNALKRGATQGLGTILPILQAFVRGFSSEIEALLVARWRDPALERPDLVVSVIPNFNRPIFRALRSFAEDIAYATIITDMVDYPPHFWMEDQDQFMICGTEKAFRQAQSSGFYAADKMFQVSGMILKEAFYTAATPASPSLRDLGLEAGKPTALIMFGGNGSLRASHTILGRFEAAGLDLQTIVLCGNNRKLLESLQGRPRCHAVGFTDAVADYLRIADFFIGKPGPGSISEAVHMNLPVIVERNASTLPQERANVDWIREHDVGLVVKSFRKEIAAATRRMIDDLPRFRANIGKHLSANTAVFEVVDVLGAIMERPQNVQPVRHSLPEPMQRLGRLQRGRALLARYRSRRAG
jgi:hypothetical protein